MKFIKHTCIISILFFNVTRVFAQNNSNMLTLPLDKYKGRLLTIAIIQDASVIIKGAKTNKLTITPSSKLELSSDVDSNKTLLTGLKNVTDITKVKSASSDEKITYNIIERKDGVIILLNPTNYKTLYIVIPETMHFGLKFKTLLPGSKISLSGLKAEIELQGNAPTIEIDDVWGPITLTSNGMNVAKYIKISNVHWEYMKRRQSPSVIVAAFNGDITFQLPDTLKATFNIRVPAGKLYSDLQISSPQIEKNTSLYKLNGGGVPIYVTTDHGNIFLKKQQ